MTRRFVPGHPASASALNKLAETTAANRPSPAGAPGDYSTSGNGTASPFSDPNPLRIFKITGTTAGGYTFVEQYDPDADGTYTDHDQGLTSSGSGLVLVVPAGVTLNTNQLIVTRRNPFHSERYEILGCLSDINPAGGSSIATQNADGTQAGLTAVMYLDQASGVDITQGGSFDTVALRLATLTQRGTMGITGDGAFGLQKMGGRKAWRDTGGTTLIGITSDASAVDTNAGTPLGVLYSDTSLLNLATGVYSGCDTISAQQTVSVHGTLTSPPTVVDSATARMRVDISGFGNFAFCEAKVFDAGLFGTYAASVYATNTGISGVSFGGGSPLVPTNTLYYDVFAPTLAIQSAADMTFAAATGVVVRSPNGNRWRLGVNNAGVITVTGPL